jgi:hypothetical protein
MALLVGHVLRLLHDDHVLHWTLLLLLAAAVLVVNVLGTRLATWLAIQFVVSPISGTSSNRWRDDAAIIQEDTYDLLTNRFRSRFRFTTAESSGR